MIAANDRVFASRPEDADADNDEATKAKLLMEEIARIEKELERKKSERLEPMVVVQKEKPLVIDDAERRRLQEEIKFMEARIQKKREGRPTPKRTISRKASERARLQAEIRKMEEELQASRQEKKEETKTAETKNTSKSGRAAFLGSIQEAAMAREASLRAEEDPVKLEPVSSSRTTTTPPPVQQEEAPSQTQSTETLRSSVEDSISQPQRQQQAPRSPSKRFQVPKETESIGRKQFLASVQQAAVARDASLREEEDPVVIAPAISENTPTPVSPQRPPRSPSKRPPLSSSGGRSSFLDSIKQAAIARDDSLREDDDDIILSQVVATKPSVSKSPSKPPRSPSKRPKPPVAADSGGRSGFLDSIKQAAIARDASLREDDEDIIVEVVAPKVPKIPPSKAPQTPKRQSSTASTSSDRASFLESVKQAAIARDDSLRCDDDPILLSPTTPHAMSNRPFDESPILREAPSVARTNLLTAISTTANGRKERLDANGGELIMTEVPGTKDRSPDILRANLLSAISTTANGRQQRLEASGGDLIMTEVPEVKDPSPDMLRANLLSAMKEAAVSREKRLQETNGELVMREYEPEVKAPRQSTPQLSFSLAEMVTKKAQEREQRLENGGEKRMTKIKEKEEYKKDFSNICLEAAALGRLTRLKEVAVEAVAVEKTPEQAWKSNGLLAIQWRCDYMSIIHEAAQLGAETKLPEKVVSNCPEEEQDWDVDDEEKELTPRMKQLMELNKRVGEGQHKVDKLVLGRKEQSIEVTSLLVRPMYAYSKIDDIELPKPAPPSFSPEKQKRRYRAREQAAARNQRPMIDIGNEVATRAWERRTRLDRPGALPKIKEICPCSYCGSASPFQTFAYREIHRKHLEEIHRQKTMAQLEEEIRELEKLTKEKEVREAERIRLQLLSEEQHQVAGSAEGHFNDMVVTGSAEGHFNDMVVAGSAEGHFNDMVVAGSAEGHFNDMVVPADAASPECFPSVSTSLPPEIGGIDEPATKMVPREEPNVTSQEQFIEVSVPAPTEQNCACVIL